MAEENSTDELIEEKAEELDGEEELLARHRKEKKDIQAKIQALKKTATKGDKKKKKDVAEEIAKLETEIETKHAAELKKFQESTAETKKISEQLEDVNLAAKGEGKVTKAQRRRDKKQDQAKERVQLIEEQEKANLLGVRHTETQKIKAILAKQNLTFFEIPSDGNCMFAAILHQINRGGVSQSVQQLRNLAAEFMRSNVDDFMPFMDEVENEEQYMKYCDDLQRTATWGSQLELRALSQVLRRPFEVVQAEGRPVIIGEEFTDPSSTPVLLTYHRHMYGLGEHYNSVQPRPADDEDNDGGQ
ncbi:deubiquitinase OTUD6B-like [Daphnia pulex]|uniref:deubiquitinase OTUD6B-like n=1 Tax=Daphnia pulex TaxID=6669 RepID=UPI001EDCDDC6|nr:deubiquitinase OTUD6B-like [Daphnia pulex]XP_046444117.1 deubiquitinase OTUD6B-like [Daphnia pulex]XP_046444118.1 deubiquitinase OTUD6B-like [Daphnia pulex]